MPPQLGALVASGGCGLLWPFSSQMPRSQLFTYLLALLSAGTDTIIFGHILSAFFQQASQTKNFIFRGEVSRRKPGRFLAVFGGIKVNSAAQSLRYNSPPPNKIPTGLK
jgi:hypothetical protein